jgi:hypothetical protein
MGNKKQQPIKFHPTVERGMRECVDLISQLGGKGGYSPLVEGLCLEYVKYVKENIDRVMADGGDREDIWKVLTDYKIVRNGKS